MAVAVMASAPAMAQKVNTQAIKTKIEKGVEASKDAKEIDRAATWLSQSRQGILRSCDSQHCIALPRPLPTTYFGHSPPGKGVER